MLTWGARPRDLDANLWLPGGTRVSFATRGSTTRFPWAQLGADDQGGFGPETITVTRLLPGTYTYAVHNLSNERALADQARPCASTAGRRR